MIKILVAEDEEKSRAATVSRLRGIMGDEALIETAADGNDAVQMALKMRPALIFMDIEMPRKTGLEAAAILHEQLPVSETTLRETLRKFFHVEHEPEKDASPFETSLRVWIAQHYTEDITLDDAAESMGMSTFYFSRQVKVLTGHTFLEYLTAYRIDKAKDLLRSTDMSVSDIGHSAGYIESNYFLRVFKRVTGMTPSTYRNQVKDEGK